MSTPLCGYDERNITIAAYVRILLRPFGAIVLVLSHLYLWRRRQDVGVSYLDVLTWMMYRKLYCIHTAHVCWDCSYSYCRKHTSSLQYNRANRVRQH